MTRVLRNLGLVSGVTQAVQTGWRGQSGSRPGLATAAMTVVCPQCPESPPQHQGAHSPHVTCCRDGEDCGTRWCPKVPSPAAAGAQEAATWTPQPARGAPLAFPPCPVGWGCARGRSSWCSPLSASQRTGTALLLLKIGIQDFPCPPCTPTAPEGSPLCSQEAQEDQGAGQQSTPNRVARPARWCHVGSPRSPPALPLLPVSPQVFLAVREVPGARLGPGNKADASTSPFCPTL